MPVSIKDFFTLLSKKADAADHIVLIDGEKRGTVKHASFRIVFVPFRTELVVDYSYELDGAVTTFSSRVAPKSVGAGGHERILVNGQDVDNDDVIIGADDTVSPADLYVEFKYTQAGEDHRVKFVAPVTAFHD